MPRDALAPDEVLGLLADALPRLTVVFEGTPATRLAAAPTDGEWSAAEVLAHLRSCSDVWGSCLQRILDEDTPTLRAVNPRTWIERTDYLTLDPVTSFRAYATQRADLLALLRPLPPQAWARTAPVTGAGKPLERSVLSYARWLAEHERPHLKQVERAVSR